MSYYCEAFDTLFRNSEQKVSDRLYEETAKLGQNPYWGRIKNFGQFPTKSGTRIKKVRLSRIGFGQMEYGWYPIVDEGCNTNLCDDVEADTITHGSTEFFYSLERSAIRTDPICLSMIPFREMGEREIQHMLKGLRLRVQFHWNEYFRSRYIHNCENKMLGLVTSQALNPDGTCDILDKQCIPGIETKNGFIFWRRGVDGNPTLNDLSLPIDERYVSVNVSVANIPRISELSPDFLEQAVQQLQFEDENMPFLDQGIQLFDVLVPDAKIGRRLSQLERLQESECLNSSIYNSSELSLKLGIKRVIRETYGIRYDPHGMKFYPDLAYNASLPAYNPDDPTTWPRFRRVFAYIPTRNPNGSIRDEINPYFLNAPFGISVIFTPTVMGWRGFPEAQSVASALKGEASRTYGGEVKWRNFYDRKCNPNQEIGHWEVNFGAGIEPDRPELGFAFFHRIDHRVALVANSCDIPILPCIDSGISPYCYNSVQAGEADLGVTAGGRGANIADNSKNGVKFFW